MTWYRNAGRTRYHLARTDYIRSGKGVCGATIPKPGFTARDSAEIGRAGQRPCDHCLKALGANCEFCQGEPEDGCHNCEIHWCFEHRHEHNCPEEDSNGTI
jgi:hypothetical protein